MLPFQENAVLGANGLVETFKKLWQTGASHLNITFKSPTGSGKTFMVSNFLRELQNDPGFDSDVAFVWITFSDELAMQSRDKFVDYFFPNIGRELRTIADFSEGVLQRDDILFLNWQKLVSSKAENRVLRRPEESEKQKEQGFYFEDVVENTRNAGREIVMIIDESHKNVTEAAYRDVIEPLRPRVILNVSATPSNIPNASDVQNLRAGFVEVKRKDVVEAGLIKEEILSQTEEDLNATEGEDLDFALLRLAKEKREFLAEEWNRLGKNINPLVLIQLPDDDTKLKDQGVETKEEVVLRFLKEKCGVPENKIALWFDKKKLNLEHISENDSPVEFMLFKYAAGTGWDCPRAHIIVMFREIESPTFKTQTLGRILRNPLPKCDLSAFPELRKGYLYTNYRKNEIAEIPSTVENKPKTEVTSLAPHFMGKFAAREAANNVVQEIRKKMFPDLMSQEMSVVSVAPAIEKALQESSAQILPGFFYENSTRVTEEQMVYNAFGNEDLNATNLQLEEKICRTASENLHAVLERHFGKNVADKSREIVAEVSRDYAETLAQGRPAAFLVDPLLKSDFISRADYGDIGKASAFQSSFIRSMNAYFGFDENAFRNPFAQAGVLEKAGIDMAPTLSDEVLVNASFAETNRLGKNVVHEMSDNEVEKIFMKACYNLLDEQTEENAKYGNVARSWGPFKEALRQWFDRYAMTAIDNIGRYKIFLKDLFRNAASKFRPAITKALKDYRPVRDAFVKLRRQQEMQEAAPFKIKTQYAYSSDYENFENASKSLVQPFKARKDAPKTEQDFIAFLEQSENVEWWFKQNDEGKDFYAIRYFNTADKKERLFYPDFLLKLKDGRIGIFDTKGGITAIHPEGRETGLFNRLKELNAAAGSEKFIGGLVLMENRQWYYHLGENYSYSANKLDEGWHPLVEAVK
ncbi:DEAD/DEAH box helicase family protein [uncultured Fibrobacter sp.]|uniref:DEAD/DEAH box helicase n=1 Tax=uncultured Fibrobacter sp. TaxID=261512 RepID=UPI00280617D4|nr:DEAD/DEAH box helicase family protein [uncultured Fibrobacter sp.]